jgi:hypothetical protein
MNEDHFSGVDSTGKQSFAWACYAIFAGRIFGERGLAEIKHGVSCDGDSGLNQVKNNFRAGNVM